MKDFTTRFHAPLEVTRPRGGRLLEAFSPKLARPIRLFERARFAQWIRLDKRRSLLGIPSMEGLGVAV